MLSRRKGWYKRVVGTEPCLRMKSMAIAKRSAACTARTCVVGLERSHLHFKNQLQCRLLSGAVTPLLVVKAKPSQGSGSPRESITTQKISTTLHEASTGSIFCTPSKSCQKGFRSLPTAQVFCFTLKINYHGKHLLLRGLQV